MAPSFALERQIAADGFDVIVGFDEVGRGSLAGPVMVGAAAFLARNLGEAQTAMPQYLADSKTLTEHRRESLYEPLQAWVDGFAIGSASNAEIDEWGISHALGIAALRALDGVERALGMGSRGDSEMHGFDARRKYSGTWVYTTHDSLQHAGGLRVGAILDGPNDYISKTLGTFEAPAVPMPAQVRTLVKADAQCASVAAAAVLAKVTRDRLMEQLAREHAEYARYGWDRNKGYGSKAHREAIAQCGPSDLHRVSWHLA